MSTLKCVKNKKSCIKKIMASLVAQEVRNLPAMQETQVLSLDREAFLEKEKAIHSSILVGEFHGLYRP